MTHFNNIVSLVTSIKFPAQAHSSQADAGALHLIHPLRRLEHRVQSLGHADVFLGGGFKVGVSLYLSGQGVSFLFGNGFSVWP